MVVVGGEGNDNYGDGLGFYVGDGGNENYGSGWRWEDVKCGGGDGCSVRIV